MTTKNPNPFGNKFNRKETAPGTKSKTTKAPAREEIPAVEPLNKTPATFRLSTTALRLIVLAVNESRRQGVRLSKEEAVDQAIRQAFGHLETEE